MIKLRETADEQHETFATSFRACYHFPAQSAAPMISSNASCIVPILCMHSIPKKARNIPNPPFKNNRHPPLTNLRYKKKETKPPHPLKQRIHPLLTPFVSISRKITASPLSYPSIPKHRPPLHHKNENPAAASNTVTPTATSWSGLVC